MKKIIIPNAVLILIALFIYGCNEDEVILQENIILENSISFTTLPVAQNNIEAMTLHIEWTQGLSEIEKMRIRRFYSQPNGQIVLHQVDRCDSNVDIESWLITFHIERHRIIEEQLPGACPCTSDPKDIIKNNEDDIDRVSYDNLCQSR